MQPLSFRRVRASHSGDANVRDVVEELDELVIAIAPVGSRVTCDPAPVDTDEDWLFLLKANKLPPGSLDPEDDTPFALLREIGFTQDGSPEFYTGNDDGGFRSWRRGDINVVTTRDSAFYERFMTATHLAKRFNLLDKGDRIALFQAILYGVDARNLEHRTAGEYGAVSCMAG